MSGTFNIDIEYPGHNTVIYHEIKRHLFNFGYRSDLDINFTNIGKGSSAHILAIDVFRKDKMPNIVVRRDELVSYF